MSFHYPKIEAQSANSLKLTCLQRVVTFVFVTPCFFLPCCFARAYNRVVGKGTRVPAAPGPGQAGTPLFDNLSRFAGV
jgi:hypothetical protein